MCIESIQIESDLHESIFKDGLKSNCKVLYYAIIPSLFETIRELGWPSLELACIYTCIVLHYAILNTPFNFSGYIINLMNFQLVPILRSIRYPPLSIAIDIPFL